MSTIKSVALAVLISVLMLATSLAGLQGISQAAPEQVATPLTFIDRVTSITQTYTTTAYNIADYSSLYAQYTIFQGASVNTATIKAQHSINGYEWEDLTTLVSNSATNGATGVITIPVRGRYVRFEVATTNSNAITPTIVGLGR